MTGLRTGGAVIVVALMATGCAGTSPGGSITPVPPGAGTTSGTGSPTTDPTSSPSGPDRTNPGGASGQADGPGVIKPAGTGVRLYFLAKGGTLVPVHRQVSVTGNAVGRAAVTALLAGPTGPERAAGIGTTVPAGTRLRGITISRGVADVDLTPEFTTGGGTLSMTARVGEFVYTLTQFPTVTGVTFRINGTPLTVLGGEGIILDRPATRSGYTSLLPAIFVDSPARGETVTSPVRVRGTANVFEGQFTVEVRDAAGRVIGRVQAHGGSGTPAPFDVTVTFPLTSPGPGTVVAYDRSAKDGSVIDVFTVPVTLDRVRLADGRYAARVTGVAASRHVVDLRLVRFFTGAAAARAAAEDHAAEVPPPNDYWIRSTSTVVTAVPVAANCRITVNTLAAEETGSATTNVSRTLQQLGRYRDVPAQLFWVTLSGGKVVRIAQQYLP